MRLLAKVIAPKKAAAIDERREMQVSTVLSSHPTYFNGFQDVSRVINKHNETKTLGKALAATTAIKLFNDQKAKHKQEVKESKALKK